MPNTDVLIVCEAGKGQTESANARIIETGAQLSGQWGGRLIAFLAGQGLAAKAEQLSRYVDELHLADSAACAHYTGEEQLDALLKLVRGLEPGAVLFGHTFIGMDLGSRLAARLGVGMASNCMGFSAENDGLCFLRPMYRGRIHAKVVVASRPVIATLQVGSAKIAPRNEAGRIVAMEAGPPGSRRIRAIKTIEPDRSGFDITKADIVVSGGRGIGTKENYALVEELAEALGGVPACSRPLVDMGWFGTNRQVGLSGNTVKPKLYVACGISGAVEHLHGMKESGLIVAINQDPGAPIFKVAHFGMVGDLNDIMPKLTAQVRAARAASASRKE